MVGPAPQTVEDVATIGAGTRWRLPRPPPRPAALLLRFRPFEGEGITGKLQVRHGAKSESSRIEIDKYESAKCCCMVCVEI
jgi:hypothetical protein